MGHGLGREPRGVLAVVVELGLEQALAGLDDPRARNLEAVADALVQKSVWIVGGDGWAYDIGYGGLDHVLASGRNVNVLVLDTEVYSNTGGQASKSTPLGAVAKFAAKGKALPKKDLGLMAMAYGYVYVAKVAFGAGDQHTLTAFREAEAFDGPSIIMALSPCIAHGYDLALGLQQQQKAVKSGAWQLYRFDPSRAARGEAALILGSRKPSLPVKDYAAGEARYRMLSLADPARAERLIGRAQRNAGAQFDLYEQLAALYAETGEREDKENGHG